MWWLNHLHFYDLGRPLTNGGEAIPKFIFLSDQFVECGNWGPMPSADRVLIARGKACGDVGAARKKTAQSYQMDAGRRIVVEDLLSERETALLGLRRRGLQTLDLPPAQITGAVLNRYLAMREAR